MLPEKPTVHSSRFHLRGFEQISRSHGVGGGAACARESAYDSNDVQEENDMTGREEQIAHRAGAQRMQRAFEISENASLRPGD